MLKGELQPKQKVMFFFDKCNAVAAREDRKPKY